jgi:hypothetical protein
MCLVLALAAHAGQNPDINILLEFENGSNSIEPASGQLFTVDIYLANFGPGGGVNTVELQLNRTFAGQIITSTNMLGDLSIGDPESGWMLATSGGDCVYPGGDGRVHIAQVWYQYLGTPGVLEIVENSASGGSGRDIADCNFDIDTWCVQIDPSGHGGVWVEPPPGDCPPDDPHPHRWDVPGEVATIQAAIDSCAAGDTVYVACGTYYEHHIADWKSGITVMSETGRADCVTIDAEEQGSVFYISQADSTTAVIGLTLTGGHAARGAGVWLYQEASPRFRDCVFTGNSAWLAGGAVSGYEGAEPRFANCTFAGNEAPIGSALEYLSNYYTLELENSIIAFNGPGEALDCGSFSTATLTCCDVYGNEGGDWVGCIAGQDTLDDNLHIDPMFCMADSQDYHLSWNSICAEANNPACGQIGALPADCGVPVSWSGDGDGVSWSDPLNWHNGVLPGPDDEVRIELSGTYTVILDVVVDIEDLVLGGESGVQTLQVSQPMTVAGTVENSGVLRVTPTGGLSGGGTLALTNTEDGTLELADADVTGLASLQNLGAIRKIGTGDSVLEVVTEDGGTNEGTLTVYGGTLTLHGDLDNGGGIEVVGGSVILNDVTHRTFTNRGNLTVGEGAGLTIGGHRELDNQAYGEGAGVTIHGDATVESGGLFRNRGHVTIEPTGGVDVYGSMIGEPKEDVMCLDILGAVHVHDGGDFTNRYIVRLLDDGVFTNEGTFDHRENAVLEGNGTFDNSSGEFLAAGIIRPYLDEPLTFIGDLVFLPTGEIQVDITGGLPRLYAQLDVEGSASYDGGVYVNVTGGYEPGVGEYFDIINVTGPPARGGAGRRRDGFTCFGGLEIPNDLYLEPEDLGSAYRLTTTDVPTGNNPPVGAPDAYTVTSDSTVTLPVLVNDTDPDAEALRVIGVVADSAHGYVSVAPGDTVLLYQPDPEYYGPDAFDYVITDCAGGVDTVGVVVNVATAVDEEPIATPSERMLAQNYPNPLNPVTTIHFSVPEPCHAELAVFTLDGRRVATLIDGTVRSGPHEVAWSGIDDRGRQLPSGVYFYRLTAGGLSEMRRMVLLK